MSQLVYRYATVDTFVKMLQRSTRSSGHVPFRAMSVMCLLLRTIFKELSSVTINRLGGIRCHTERPFLRARWSSRLDRLISTIRRMRRQVPLEEDQSKNKPPSVQADWRVAVG